MTRKNFILALGIIGCRSGLEVGNTADTTTAQVISFASPVARTAVHARGVAVGQMSGDGRLDLATTGAEVYFGMGDGTLADPVAYAQEDAQAVAVGDFNGDGKPDIATVTGSIVIVRLNRGDGTFPGEVAYSTGPGARAIAAGDLDRDGRTDFAVGGDDGVSILLGRGDGTFAAPATMPAGAAPAAVAIGDIDVDGRADLAVANADGLILLFGRGDGTFEPSVSRAVPGRPRAIAIGHIDSDGWPDLVVANEEDVHVILNYGGIFRPGEISFPVAYGVGTGVSAVALADFDDDGWLDIAATFGKGVSVRRNLRALGFGIFGPVDAITWPSAPSGIAVGDFDNDSKLDLAVAEESNGVIDVLRNTSP